jgi:hypothetical protein
MPIIRGFQVVHGQWMCVQSVEHILDGNLTMLLLKYNEFRRFTNSVADRTTGNTIRTSFDGLVIDYLISDACMFIIIFNLY